MPDELLGNLLIFTRTLRAAGVSVRAGGLPDAVRALDLVGLRRKTDVRDALRAVLISRHEDGEPFERIFERFWRVWSEGSRALPQPMQVPPRVRSSVRTMAPGSGSADRGDEMPSSDERPVAVQTYSPDETWRRRDFADFSRDDLIRAEAALSKLAWNPGVRLTRRWVSGSGRRIDLRRLLQANRRNAPEILEIPTRVRRVAPRPLILICDVSGSMEPYARMLLLFAHAIAGGERTVEVFVFSTRLTRVTRQFTAARMDVAMAGLRDAVGDWSGGTRIGDAIHAFNAQWARRVLQRGPVVLLISDGWDLGDPAILAREMARLQRNVFRLVWLNPLLGSAGYEPVARGMRAALPFVDDFVPVHNMESLETLARNLNTLAQTRAARGRRRTWN
ncbi:MAG TPA: VWA domain-containing protein [Vicinamibacterales bacterium]